MVRQCEKCDQCNQPNHCWDIMHGKGIGLKGDDYSRSTKQKLWVHS